MTFNSQVTCWVVTDGKSGMENQCLGLAAALELTPIVKRVKLRAPWKQLAPFMRFGLSCAFDHTGDPVAPPWPQLLIATGRLSVPAALYVRDMSRRAGKPAFTVQLQDPVIAPTNFDLVVVPQHDKLRGPNVITTRGALHRVTKDMLQTEAAKFLSEIAHLPSPRIAVLLGGTNAVYRLTPVEMKPLAEKLVQAAKSTGGSLVITPSRRTGDDNMAMLKDILRGTNAYIWDGKGENPYYGILGAADYIIATGDSVNMVTEACSTGKPVYVIDLPGPGSDKFRRFHQALRNDGLTRAFEGKLENWGYTPFNDTQTIVDRIKSGFKR